MSRAIDNVCIVGAGYMGNQIALQCAVFAKKVYLYDIRDEALRGSRGVIAEFLDRMTNEGYVSMDRRESIMNRIRCTPDFAQAAATADLVVEAAQEDISVKREIFNKLDQLCPRETILATNSSSIRIDRIETATNRPEQVLNTHFVQPIWQHPFVELMRGTTTSESTWNSVQSFMTSIGMLPILVRKQSTGFVFNRIWRAVKKEALKVVDQGIADVQDVDRTWMIHMETPIGPLAQMDIIGLDVVRDIELVYFEESGDPVDAPPKILLDKIENGQLGVKTGKGFYSYPNPAWQAPDFCKVPAI